MYLHHDNWHWFSKTKFSILINEHPVAVYVTHDSNDELSSTVSFSGFIEFIEENVDS